MKTKKITVRVLESLVNPGSYLDHSKVQELYTVTPNGVVHELVNLKALKGWIIDKVDYVGSSIHFTLKKPKE